MADVGDRGENGAPSAVLLAPAGAAVTVDTAAGAAPPAEPPTARPATGGHRRRLRPERLYQALFLLPATGFLVMYFGYPVVKNILMGFQDYTTATFFTGSSPFIGWTNYHAVTHASVFDKALVNTALFTVGSIVCQFSIGLALAVFFRNKFPLSGVLRALLLLPWLIPLIASGTVWKWMLDMDGGVVNRILSSLHLVSGQNPGWLTDPSLALISVIMVNIWIGIPFNTTILYGGLQDIPEELYEAAKLDGATGWKGFRYVTWPLLKQVRNVVLVLGVVYTLKVIDIILVLTNGGPANSTQTIATQSYNLSFQQFNFGQGAAMSNILILISLVFAVIYLRASRRAVDE